MKFSHGDALTAGSANIILDVPDGYDAVVTYLFISNTGATKNIDAKWTHSGVDIDFLAGKNVSGGDFLEFGGQYGEFLVAKEGDTLVLTTSKTPSSATDTGTTGQIAWDSDYIYVCVATNTWKRVAISTW